MQPDDQSVPFPKRVGAQLMPRAQVSKGMKVLDLGCGYGVQSIVLSELVGPEGRVIAVDPEAERIQAAKDKNSRTNIEYSVGNDQSFPGDQYNLVFANGVVHWVEDKEALFRRVFDKLRPGGIFALSTTNGRINFPVSSLRFFDLIHPNFLEEVYYEKRLVEVASVYRDISKSVGFEIDLMDSLTMLFHYSNTEALINWFSMLLPDHVNKESIDQTALQSYMEKYEEVIPKEPVPYDMLFIRLVKPN